MLASADYCTESGDIAHFILDPKSREIIIACFEQPMEDLCYFLKQENGLMAPVTKAQSRKAMAESRKALDRLMAPVTKAESRKALDRLNANAKIEWSYPPYTEEQPKLKRYRPMGPGLTPDLGDMFDDHEWKTKSRRKFNEDVESSYFCRECLARMHTTRRNAALTRVWVRLPGMRQCYYLRTENAITPVSDTDFYGAEPLRISQEQLDAQEKRDAPEKREKPEPRQTKSSRSKRTSAAPPRPAESPKGISLQPQA